MDLRACPLIEFTRALFYGDMSLKNAPIILGVESSCDETAVCLLQDQVVLSAQLFSQIALHSAWGGVVPEIASRDHVRRCLILIDQALKEAGLQKDDIDLIAYTAGPGLLGALFVGACVARGLAFALRKPYVPIHHMEAHLLVPLLESNVAPPFAALLVSGGHSQFYGVKAIGEYELVGETLDDAAGEAFDKVAKILKLGYPGGPALSALAAEGEASFDLPRPMCDRPGFDLSFSGLKTATLQLVQRLEAEGVLQDRLADVAASFQLAVVDTLVRKSERVLRYLEVNTLVVAGGVSANQCLRQALEARAIKRDWKIVYPRLDWCTDNGVMVAYAGWHALRRGLMQTDQLSPLGVRARWSMQSLSPSLKNEDKR